MAKRIFDLFFSSIGLLVLFPFLLAVALLIVVDSKGGVFYFQTRVGRYGKDFKLWKFRSMQPNADKKGLLTVGAKDSRVTRMGYYLRKYKIDELPQLINVLLGSMSFVGPRPEVRKYVDLYNDEQRQILNLKPGITDYASIEFSDENELLLQQTNPEEFYIREIMPAKLKLNMKYASNVGLISDFKIILNTLYKILS